MDYSSIRNLIFKLEPETAHNLVKNSSKIAENYLPFVFSILCKKYCIDKPELIQNILGLSFTNPVGLAAGFDKNAQMLRLLASFGFSHLEYGTITPRHQSGNKQPRIFRHIQEETLQNAMGFNNIGLEKMKKQLKNLYPFCVPLGANLGKNKDTKPEDAINDYVILVEGLKNFCDYFVINISSPNTPGLRDLQNEKFVKELLETLTPLTDKPIFLKVDPDSPIDSTLNICKCAVDSNTKGIIATNTTTDYSLIKNPQDSGGLSGGALREKSFLVFEEIAKEFFGKAILISVGGISDASEAYRRIKAGASLVQIYSAFIFRGPRVIKNINEGLIELLKQDGFANISEAVGIHRK